MSTDPAPILHDIAEQEARILLQRERAKAASATSSLLGRSYMQTKTMSERMRSVNFSPFPGFSGYARNLQSVTLLTWVEIVGPILLALAIWYGIARTRHRTRAEREQTERATLKLYREEASTPSEWLKLGKHSRCSAERKAMDWVFTLEGGAAIGFLLVIIWLIIHRECAASNQRRAKAR